jgi:Pyruvate/2-oxoacid:ferredoxin oxidoreductase gamma subunit
MLESYKINFGKQITSTINNTIKNIIDDEFEEMKKRVDARRKEVYTLAATNFTRLARMEIVGEDLVFHIVHK